MQAVTHPPRRSNVPERHENCLKAGQGKRAVFSCGKAGGRAPWSNKELQPLIDHFQTTHVVGMEQRMPCVTCGQKIEEGRLQGQPPVLAKYCLKCRAERRRQARVKYVWRPDWDSYLRAHYHGGLNQRFRVLNRMVRETGVPRWFIKRRAARLGLTMHMDRRPWTPAERELIERLVGRVSTATIAKRLHRPEGSVVNKLKRMGTSRRVREGYTMRDLEMCLGEDHRTIAGWIKNGWLRDRLQSTRRHDGNGNDIHRIREKDVLSFIKRHPEEINLGKVDQTWFLDLVLLRGRELQEVTSSSKTIER